jgi:hypothetical protein
MGKAIGGLVGAVFALTAGLLLLGVIRDGKGQLTNARWLTPCGLFLLQRISPTRGTRSGVRDP